MPKQDTVPPLEVCKPWLIEVAMVVNVAGADEAEVVGKWVTDRITNGEPLDGLPIKGAIVAHVDREQWS